MDHMEITEESEKPRRSVSGRRNLTIRQVLAVVFFCGGLSFPILAAPQAREDFSKGVITDKEAKALNVGGEVLCYVY